jgi:glycosyltransferase involved in cell wall biosynthesis
MLSSVAPETLARRVVLEPRLGLTAARCTGISAARGEAIVFVDDDTVLDEDYLERAGELLRREKHVGAAGGRIAGEFEIPVESWMLEALGNLAIRNFGDRPIRALIYDEPGPWEPCGAGMVIRTVIAQSYSEEALTSEGHRTDRVGSSLSSGGDTELARTACDLGFYLAYEPTLRLTHLIPKERLTLGYLARISYNVQRDGWLLARRQGLKGRMPWEKYFAGCLAVPVRTICGSPRRWLLRMASEFGRLRGCRNPSPQFRPLGQAGMGGSE